MQAFHGNEGERHYQLIDARGPDEFAAGHIDGAVNFPFAKIFDVNTK